MQLFDYPSVRYWSKESNGTRTGGRKRFFFNSRPMSRPWSHGAAPVESCLSLSKRCPWGRLGSKLYTRKRLHRTRRRLQHISANSLSTATHSGMNYLAMASRALEPPKNRRMRYRRLPTTRPTPRDDQEPICPRKKCAIWARWRPVTVKNVNYLRPPRNRNSGLVGPYTTPAIVNYEYMTSTL